MPKAKTPRPTKVKAEKKVLQMPENGNGNGNGHDRATDVESEIRVRAYEIYEQRGYTNGRADEDWFQAEREVLARHGNQVHTA